VRFVGLLIVIVVAVALYLADMPSRGTAPPRATGPEWRRTSEGWIKVGSDGAAGLVAPDPEPAEPPKLHPGLLAAFLLAAGLVALIWFEGSTATTFVEKPERVGRRLD
jgi:hypothetical protein